MTGKIVSPNRHSEAQTAGDSAVQREFSQYAFSRHPSLPDSLSGDRFSFVGGAPDLSTASRVFNLAISNENPFVISGPLGVGKSVLSWQVMKEADSRGYLPIMIYAPDLVKQGDTEPFHRGDSQLPLSKVGELSDVLSKLRILDGTDASYGRKILLVIDGIDPQHYNPIGNPGSAVLRFVEEAGMKVILNVNSEGSALSGGTIDTYLSLLNPKKYAIAGLALVSDGETRTAERKDIVST